MISDFFNIIITHAFMGRAVVAAVLVGIIAAAIGTFIILRGLSLMGDAIAHAVIPGVAISQVFGISHLIGASVFGVLASFAIGFISEKSKLKKDAIIGIVFSSFFALGLVLISRIRTVTDLHSILFGNVLTVSVSDITAISVIGILLFLFIALLYKELLITSSDETLAKVYGMKTRAIHYAFLIYADIDNCYVLASGRSYPHCSHDNCASRHKLSFNQQTARYACTFNCHW